MRWLPLFLALVSVPAATPQAIRAEDLPLPPGAYRAVNPVVVPKRIQKKQPDYSEEGRIAGLEGTVWVTGVIAEDGSPRDVRVTGPLGLGLEEKALEAVRECVFSPARTKENLYPCSRRSRLIFSRRKRSRAGI